MKKILRKFLPLLFLVSLTSCKQLVDSVEETFSYWTDSAKIIGIEIPSGVPVDGDGFSSLPSGKDAHIYFNLHNSQKFEFLMPNDPDAPADIIIFDENVKGKSGGRPEFGEDYSLAQKAFDKLELTYTKEFLLKNEQGKADLNPKINLYNKNDKRKFDQNYSYKLRANTPPPKPQWFTTGKIQQGTDWYYVLIFKFKGIDHSIDTENLLHGDISEIYLTEGESQKNSIPVKLTKHGFDVSESLGRLLSPTETISPLEAQDIAGGNLSLFEGIPNENDRKRMLCIKTGVKIGQSLSYGLKLKDSKSLYSPETKGKTDSAKLPVPQISYDSGMNTLTSSGVYTDNETDLSIGTSTNPIHISSCFGNAVVLKAHNTAYPSDVTIEAEVKLSDSTPAPSGFTGPKGRIQKSGGITKILLDPIPGVDEIYEVKLKASGPNYTDSDEKTYYYQIKKEVRTGDSSWHNLKKAVNLASFGDTIYIKGHIISTSAANNSGEIEVKEDINIQGLNGKAGDIIDANKDGSNKPGTLHRIFTIKIGKTLNLTGLTLQNGKVEGSPHEATGGAIKAGNGSVLTLDNTDIADSEAGMAGGAISSTGNIDIKGNSVIRNNRTISSNGLGGAIYNGGILKISGSAKITIDPTKNDVYLPAEKVITVTGALTETYVARITPANNTYTPGRQVVKGESYTLTDEDISKFSLTQKPGQTWSLQRVSSLNALVLKKEITEITSWQGLQDAVNAANSGDTITVKNTLIADTTTSEISITKNLTIKGESTSAVLNADEKHRIFKVYNGASLKLKDITLKKGKDSPGAGVHVTGASLEIENVTITECKNNASLGEGGAIYISSSSDGRLWIKGSSKILSNTAEKGAGIYIHTDSGENKIEGSAEISGNICTSNGKGGGIYLYKGSLVLQGSAKILNNESSVGADGGGGVYISEHGTLTVKNSCIIQGNKAKNSNGSIITGNGGGIYNLGKLIMEGGEIKENEAKLGGAVYNNGTFKISGSAKIDPSAVPDENTLGKNDIYLPADKVITVTGSLTETSVARISPVSPYTAGRQVVEGDPTASPPIDLSSQVSKFKVTDDTDSKKWKINDAGQLKLANKAITVTSWKKLKEAVQNSSENDTIIIDGNIKAVYSNSDTENYGTIEITKNMTIKGNNPSSRNIMELNLDTFISSGISKKHKIFKIKNDAVVRLENLELKNGYSTDSGGGIEIVSGNVTLSKVTIDNCTAKANGGGIVVLGGSLKIENGSLIQNCKALKDTGSSTTAHGGGIFVGSSGTLELSGVKIYKNEAKIYGGGIYTKGNTKIVSGVVEENSSDSRGGGIYLAGGTLNMSGGEIKKNTAGQGGGCYFENGTFNISGVAKITPSTDGDEHTHGRNDVYLFNNKTIKITGNLTAGQNQAARITVPDGNYLNTTTVLTGSTAENANKFKVTKKGAQNWYVDNDGKLTTTAP